MDPAVVTGKEQPEKHRRRQKDAHAMLGQLNVGSGVHDPRCQSKRRSQVSVQKVRVKETKVPNPRDMPTGEIGVPKLERIFKAHLVVNK